MGYLDCGQIHCYSNRSHSPQIRLRPRLHPQSLSYSEWVTGTRLPVIDYFIPFHSFALGPITSDHSSRVVVPIFVLVWVGNYQKFPCSRVPTRTIVCVLGSATNT